MKSIHYYEKPLYNRPSKGKLAVFAFVLVLGAVLLTLLCLAGCTSQALPGVTPAEHRLDTAQAKQLSQAAAAVDAAKVANQANPEGLPKTATAGELTVADANLPPAQPEDSREALARVNAALTGQLAAAQKGWNAAVAQADALNGKIAQLEQQVAAERAAAAANEKKANDRLCIIAALLVGGGLAVAAALALAAGLYFGWAKLEFGAAGLGLCGTLAFLAATQVGSAHFNTLATLAVVGGVTAAVYAVWQGFARGGALQAKAGGFDQLLNALEKFAGEVAGDAKADAKKIWHWIGVELDRAQKALIADWRKLEAIFSPSSPPAVPAPGNTTTVTQVK